MIRRVLVGCVGLALCAGAAGQARPAAGRAATVKPGAAEGRVISGVVLNRVTGEPVRDADVSLEDTRDRAARVDTKSDAEGRFVFAHLPTGKYALSASRRGYIASSFDEHEGGFSTAIATGDGLVSTELKFLLPPQAIITGAVTDDTGDAVEQAMVALFRVEGRSGESRTVRVANSNTDDAGDYEFARVAPGTYFVVVTAQPWYARHRLAPSASASERAPLDVAYATTYYAGATDADAATPIPVKAGDRIPLNVTLHAVPAVRIRLTLPGAGPADVPLIPQLRGSVFGKPDVAQTSVETTQREGVRVMELVGIAPGQYDLELMRNGPERTQYAHVDASGGPVLIEDGGLSTLAEVNGKISLQSGSALPADAGVALVGDSDQPAMVSRVVNGSFHFENVYPGSYRLVAGSQNVAITVRHMAAEGASVADNEVKIGSGSVMLAATVDAGVTLVNGLAKRKDKPVTGAMMVLVPEDGERENIRRDQTDSDGSFTLRAVVPGRYRLVAIDDGWPLEWARPEVMQPYLAHGQKVTVPAGVKEFQLQNPVEVQSR